jgi:DNA helicase-2/ATP-dependent DNA helicase PcrA
VVQALDVSAAAAGRESAIEFWRGGSEASESGWTEAGVRPKPPPIPPRLPENGNGAAYAEGMLVRHPNYGTGRIIEVSGYGALRKVKIRFSAAGERSFIADKVTLEVVRKG